MKVGLLKGGIMKGTESDEDHELIAKTVEEEK